MRSICWMAGIVLLVLAGASCDVTQPSQLGSQSFSLSFGASGGQADVFYVYQTVELDANQNPVGNPFLSCFFSSNGMGGVAKTAPTSWPFHFIVEVSVLRAGETVYEPVTSAQAINNPTWNLTNYDTTNNVNLANPPPQIPPGRGSTVVGPGGKTYRFLPQGRTAKTQVNGAVVQAIRCGATATTGCNPWATVYGDGLCSLANPGYSRVSSPPGSASPPPYPFPITLNKGDTVAVNARLANAPAMVPPSGAPPSVSLNASFMLGSSPVTVEGTLAEAAPHAGFRFVYRTR